MANSMSKRNLIIVNFIIVSYFILVWLVSFYKIDFFLIGIVTEILTIPFIIAQIVVLSIGIKYLISHKSDFLAIISVLTLAICAIITIGSLIINCNFF